jgi:hypothetical protein
MFKRKWHISYLVVICHRIGKGKNNKITERKLNVFQMQTGMIQLVNSSDFQTLSCLRITGRIVGNLPVPTILSLPVSL